MLPPRRTARVRSPRLAIPLTRDCTPAPFAINSVLQVVGHGACQCAWPVDLWTSPADRPEPCGTCGQVVDNLPVDHDLSTLSGLSPTGSTGPTSNSFNSNRKRTYAGVCISWVRFPEHKWVRFPERRGYSIVRTPPCVFPIIWTDPTYQSGICPVCTVASPSRHFASHAQLRDTTAAPYHYRFSIFCSLLLPCARRSTSEPVFKLGHDTFPSSLTNQRAPRLMTRARGRIPPGITPP
jgi:hypothetical protein